MSQPTQIFVFQVDISCNRVSTHNRHFFQTVPDRTIELSPLSLSLSFLLIQPNFTGQISIDTHIRFNTMLLPRVLFTICVSLNRRSARQFYSMSTSKQVNKQLALRSTSHHSTTLESSASPRMNVHSFGTMPQNMSIKTPCGCFRLCHRLSPYLLAAFSSSTRFVIHKIFTTPYNHHGIVDNSSTYRQTFTDHTLVHSLLSFIHAFW